jgi:hypothetical protein
MRRRQLDAAQQLAAALLGPAAQDHAMPPYVTAHFVRSVAEWLLGVLLKEQPAGLSRKQQNSQQEEEERQQRRARERPEAWWLLHRCLSQGSHMLQDVNINTAISLSAASACSAAAQQLPSEAAADLAAAVSAALQVLGSAYGMAYRPSLEHQAVLLEAALQGLQAALPAAEAASPAGPAARAGAVFARLAEHLLLSFRAAAACHPAPRKVSSGRGMRPHPPWWALHCAGLRAAQGVAAVARNPSRCAHPGRSWPASTPGPLGQAPGLPATWVRTRAPGHQCPCLMCKHHVPACRPSHAC